MIRHPRNIISFKQAISVVAAHFGCSRHQAEALFDSESFPPTSTASMDMVKVSGFRFDHIAKWLETHDRHGAEISEPVEVTVSSPDWSGQNSTLADGKRNPFADPINWSRCTQAIEANKEKAERMCIAAGKDFAQFT